MIDFCAASSAAATGCGVEVKGGGASAPSPDLIPFPANLRKQLRSYRKKMKVRPLTPQIRDLVLHIVAREYGIDANEIMSEVRTADVAEARMVIYWFLRSYTTNTQGDRAPYQQIARLMNRRCHRTIMHGYRVIDGFIQIEDKQVTDRLQRIKTAINY